MVADAPIPLSVRQISTLIVTSDLPVHPESRVREAGSANCKRYANRRVDYRTIGTFRTITMVSSIAAVVLVMLICDHLWGELIELDAGVTRVCGCSRHKGACVDITRKCRLSMCHLVRFPHCEWNLSTVYTGYQMCMS